MKPFAMYDPGTPEEEKKMDRQMGYLVFTCIAAIALCFVLRLLNLI
jgi:hypothetical protein